MQCVSMCNCALYCEQSAGISLSEVCTVRQGVTHTVQHVQQVLHVQYAMCSTQCSMFKVQHAGVTQRVSPAPASAPSGVQNALELKPSSAILCTLCRSPCTGCTPDVSSSSSFLFQKITSSWPRCGETESRSESASLPSIGSFLRLSDDGKERVESDGASESTLPVIEDVFAWKC